MLRTGASCQWPCKGPILKVDPQELPVVGSREGAEAGMSGHEGGKKRPLKQAKKQAKEID